MLHYAIPLIRLLHLSRFDLRFAAAIAAFSPLQCRHADAAAFFFFFFAIHYAHARSGAFICYMLLPFDARFMRWQRYHY